MWQDRTGRVGIRLVSVPPTSKRILHRWLQEHAVADSGEAVEFEARNPGPAGTGALAASNRRERERRACSLGVDVYREDSNVPNRSTLSDISTGGCYVETPEPFPQGTVLTIVVRTTDGKLCVAGKSRKHASRIRHGGALRARERGRAYPCRAAHRLCPIRTAGKALIFAARVFDVNGWPVSVRARLGENTRARFSARSQGQFLVPMRATPSPC
jgi:hypothetical protein